MTTDNDAAHEGEILPEQEPPAQIDHRRAACSLDDAYIFNYTQNPKAGKTAALRAAGYEGEYVSQEAHRMHNRLRDKIDAVMREYTRDLGALSRYQLENILQSSPENVGFSNMLAAIKLGYDFADKYAPEDTTAQRPALNQITERIEQLQKQLSDAGALPAPSK